MQSLCLKLLSVVTMSCVVPAWAQTCEQLPAPLSIADSDGCLAIVPIAERAAGDTDHEPRVLIVLLHGDGGGSLKQRHIDRWTTVGNALKDAGQVVVFVIRPGYRSPAGDSSGWANPQDDDYTPQNIERVAQALRALRERYRAAKVLLVGHSGGAATSALVLGRHPGAADAALLLGCPCDVPPWRAHRSAQRGRNANWSRSLNPLDAVATIPTETPVITITGAQDDNTLPEFARRWTAEATSRGLAARFEAVHGRDHNSILAWPEIPQRVTELVQALTGDQPPRTVSDP